jgi:hypothetical protein
VTFGSASIDVATVARTLNTTSRHLIARLGRLGVPTVGGFRDAGARCGYLVRTTDVVGALLAPHSEPPT